MDRRRVELVGSVGKQLNSGRRSNSRTVHHVKPVCMVSGTNVPRSRRAVGGQHFSVQNIQSSSVAPYTMSLNYARINLISTVNGAMV
jgi:hypothetical protein